MSNKYSETQENKIVEAMKKSNDFDSMKSNLQGLLKDKEFSGITIREMLSKAQHLGRTIEGLEYHKKTYETKTGEKPIRKASLIAELAGLLGVQVDTLDSMEGANKAVLSLLINTLKAKK